MTNLLNKIQPKLGLIFALLLGLLVILLWLSPAEQTLGQSIKLVYLHGALVRTAIILFAVSVPVNLGALVTKRENWFVWGKALIFSTVVIWLLHTLFSMITTYATWGVFIAWFEPRTRFTFNLAAVSLVVVLVTHLVKNRVFSSVAFLLLAGLTLMLLPTLGLVQHPLDPIGMSTSGQIRLFYAGISLITLGLGGLLAIWMRGKVGPKFP